MKFRGFTIQSPVKRHFTWTDLIARTSDVTIVWIKRLREWQGLQTRQTPSRRPSSWKSLSTWRRPKKLCSVCPAGAFETGNIRTRLQGAGLSAPKKVKSSWFFYYWSITTVPLWPDYDSDLKWHLHWVLGLIFVLFFKFNLPCGTGYSFSV